MTDGANAILDPHVIVAIALVALAIVVTLLVICANQAGADRRKPPQ